jgi:hypothetical protein
VVDQAKESQLFEDLKAGNDGDFASHFSKIAWEERVEYAKQLESDFRSSRSQQGKESQLPEVFPDIKGYTDYMGNKKEYVAGINVVEERSWLNPKRWFGSERTDKYQVFSPSIREQIDHKIGRWLQTER